MIVAYFMDFPFSLFESEELYYEYLQNQPLEDRIYYTKEFVCF